MTTSKENRNAQRKNLTAREPRGRQHPARVVARLVRAWASWKVVRDLSAKQRAVRQLHDRTRERLRRKLSQPQRYVCRGRHLGEGEAIERLGIDDVERAVMGEIGPSGHSPRRRNFPSNEASSPRHCSACRRWNSIRCCSSADKLNSGAGCLPHLTGSCVAAVSDRKGQSHPLPLSRRHRCLDARWPRPHRGGGRGRRTAVAAKAFSGGARASDHEAAGRRAVSPTDREPPSNSPKLAPTWLQLVPDVADLAVL